MNLYWREHPTEGYLLIVAFDGSNYFCGPTKDLDKMRSQFVSAQAAQQLRKIPARRSTRP